VRSIVQRLTAPFGIEDHFDVSMVRTGVNQVEVEATFPASLLIPASLKTSPPRRELVLRLARALGRLRAGSYLATRLSARELGITLAASMRSRYYGRGLRPRRSSVIWRRRWRASRRAATVARSTGAWSASPRPGRST
jgi:hypothetical protein